MKLLDIVKYAKESDEDFRHRAIVTCDTTSRKMDYCDLEDLAVAQIVSQLDDSVEVHCSRMLALYTTGEYGMEWILAIIDEMNKVTQRLGPRGSNKKNDNKDHFVQIVFIERIDKLTINKGVSVPKQSKARKRCPLFHSPNMFTTSNQRTFLPVLHRLTMQPPIPPPIPPHSPPYSPLP